MNNSKLVYLLETSEGTSMFNRAGFVGSPLMKTWLIYTFSLCESDLNLNWRDKIHKRLFLTAAATA